MLATQFRSGFGFRWLSESEIRPTSGETCWIC